MIRVQSKNTWTTRATSLLLQPLGDIHIILRLHLYELTVMLREGGDSERAAKPSTTVQDCILWHKCETAGYLWLNLTISNLHCGHKLGVCNNLSGYLQLGLWWLKKKHSPPPQPQPDLCLNPNQIRCLVYHNLQLKTYPNETERCSILYSLVYLNLIC